MTEPQRHSAAILSVGDELVLGQISDTNAAFAARELLVRGWRVDEVRVVGDSLPLIISAISELASRHEMLLISGGLGPTDDDLTRAALAGAAGVGLIENSDLLAEIKARFRQINRPMADRNRVQALLPEGAQGISNPVGTAPGVEVSINGCRCFAVPGVPREMKHLLNEAILPVIGRGPDSFTLVRELHMWGIGESTLAEEINHLMVRGRRPEVGTRVNDSIITVRIVASGEDEDEVRQLVARDEDDLRARLSEYIFGVDGVTLEEALVLRLSDIGQTVTVAESCTGGWLGKLITDVPGSSAVLKEGFITYSNAAKITRLGVPEELLLEHGAVSEPVARAMAEGVRRVTGADHGIGITGVAGPGGGTEEKPVGLVHIAIAGKAHTIHQECRLCLGREGNRLRSARTAMGMLLRIIG